MADSNTTDGGRIVKMEVDYSSTCDEKIPLCKSMVAEGKLNEALEILYALEKQTRTVSFLVSLSDLRLDSNVFGAGCRRDIDRQDSRGHRADLLRGQAVGPA